MFMNIVSIVLWGGIAVSAIMKPEPDPQMSAWLTMICGIIIGFNLNSVIEIAVCGEDK